jgi:protoheme IX farnesyltransferase
VEQTKAISTSFYSLAIQWVKDIAALTKFRLATLVVFSAVIGYLFGVGGNYNLLHILILALGGMLVTGASNTINQIIEKDIDKLMKRTQNRPLPAGRLSVLTAILTAGITGIAGILLLTYYFNPISGVLSAVSLLSYAFVYTPLKRVSPIAVFVGAIPGALPPMIGYVCATGQIDFVATTLFSIQFLWQFPHFWAIAWVQYEDYKKAGIMLLPSSTGKTAKSAMQVFIYTATLLIVSMVPYFFGMVGMIGTAAIFIMGLVFLWQAFNLYRKCDDKSARILMFGSFAYLPVVQLAMILDKI